MAMPIDNNVIAICAAPSSLNLFLGMVELIGKLQWVPTRFSYVRRRSSSYWRVDFVDGSKSILVRMLLGIIFNHKFYQTPCIRPA